MYAQQKAMSPTRSGTGYAADAMIRPGMLSPRGGATSREGQVLSPWRMAHLTQSPNVTAPSRARRSPSPVRNVVAAPRAALAPSVSMRSATASDIQQRDEYEARVHGALLKTAQFRYVEVGRPTRDSGRPYLVVTERAKPMRVIFVDARYYAYTIRDIAVEEMRKMTQREKDLKPVGGIIVVTDKSQVTTAARERLLQENFLFVRDDKNLAFSLGRAVDALLEADGHGTTVHALGLFGGEGEVNLSALEENKKRALVAEARTMPGSFRK